MTTVSHYLYNEPCQKFIVLATDLYFMAQRKYFDVNILEFVLPIICSL